MKELLEFIKKEGFVLYRDEKWYKKGNWRPWRPVIYYTDEELIELFTKDSMLNK